MRPRMKILCGILASLAVVLGLATAATASELSPKQMLGKHIFFDTNLSRPVGQSCASCHDPATGFADPRQQLPVSTGAVPSRFGSRNASAVAYAAFSPPFQFLPDMGPGMKGVYMGGQFWDGRVSTLVEQATLPFLNPLEMNNPNKKAVVNAIRVGDYASLFEQVYGRKSLHPKNTETAFDQVADALAAYESSAEVSPFNSRYDAYLADPAAAPLSEQESRGLSLFEGKAGCSACHRSRPSVTGSPPLFTSFHHANVGVPRNPANPFYSLPKPFNPLGASFVDLGDGSFVGDGNWDGRFKMPSLRNVALTAPYMHNGFFTDLRDVVEFYNTRDTSDLWPAPEVNKNVIVNPPGRKDVALGNLHLTEAEVDDVVAFLSTLSDR